MSHPTLTTLYRIGAGSGVGSALILLVNAAKRAEVIPTSAITQLVAPLAQILALALVASLYLAFGRRGGALVAFVATLLRGRQVPTVPLVLYATGAVPVALRAFVPELALDLGLVTLAVGIGWLATWLFQESGHITTRAVARHASSRMVETAA